MKKKEGHKKDKTMKQIVMLAVVYACFCPSTWAEQEETVSSLSKEIAAKETEKRKIDKENPCVLYMEEDNTGMNVKKTMDRCKGKYPKGITYVNQTFFCPIHKVSNPCIKTMYGAEWCKKAQLARVQWSNLVKKIPKTEECTTKVEAIQERIAELKEKIEGLKAEERQRKAEERKQKQESKAK